MPDKKAERDNGILYYRRQCRFPENGQAGYWFLFSGIYCENQPFDVFLKNTQSHFIVRMETRKEKAAEKKRCNSHNCAQAVVCTYCDLVGLSEETALDICGAYGTGMGNMEGTCGALVGAGMILSLATKDRILSRSRMKHIMTEFQQRNGATQCKLLKGVGTGKPLRDCPDCVADASEFLEEFLG